MNNHLADIALSFVKGLSCRAIRHLLALGYSADNLYSMGRSELKELFGGHLSIVESIVEKTTMTRAEEELRFAEKHGIKVLHCLDSEFPQRLNGPNCEDTPPLLYYKGNADLNAPRSVGIVGSRKATDYGRQMTRQLVEGMQGEDILVVSGLAYGIDTAAHENAINYQLPTVAVVAHGLDQIYPAQNRNLAKKMVQGEGGILTEYPSQTRIHPSYFPARNRIVAALSDVVTVVEAAKTGGALITANLAWGYNREVCAFPGRVGDKTSEGCNAIIANHKASLIMGAKELFFVMNWDQKISSVGTQQTLALNLDANESALLSLLNENGEMTLDQLGQTSNMERPILVSTLLNLELKNLIQALPGRRYKAW